MNRTKEELPVIGQEIFAEDQIYKLVTFLNHALKDRGLIFGLTIDKVSGDFRLTIYDTSLPNLKGEE